MNPIVEKWLQKQKAAQSASQRAEREKFLIELGLVKKSHFVDVYGNTLTKEQYDGCIAAGFTAYESKEALDVTDEEYAEICKYAPKQRIINDKNMIINNINSKSENEIVKVANAVKIMGIILWIILALIGLVSGLAVASSSWDFSFGLFIAYFFGGAFSGFICWLGCYMVWAVLKVFTNISRTLYRIEEKQK